MASNPRIARTLALAPRLLPAACVLAACNFEVPSSAYLVETKLLTVMIEVVELGELNPDRVGVPSDVPIAEAMPHDRLAFEAYVVDRSGVRIPSAELDSLWFQCGVFDCGEGGFPAEDPLFDIDCDDLDDHGLVWDMDVVCRLGRGDGVFEYQLPELGQLMAEKRVASYYGVIAWEGRSAESCWEARRAGEGPLDRCGFVMRAVKIGPSWWMLAYAETVGLQSPIPIPQIPAAVYTQLANRVPDPIFTVSIDGEQRGVWPQHTSFEVEPGARISIERFYLPATQFLQTYFVAVPVDAVGAEWIFQPATEVLGEVPYSSNAIVWIEFEPSESQPFPSSWEFVVDEYTDPGTSRILLVYFDDRYGEGVATFEFEVQG